MENVVSIKNGEHLISARELHKGLEIGKDFTTWVKFINKYGFEEGEDYSRIWIDTRVTKNGEVAITSVEPTEDKWAYKSDYLFKIDMAKEVCMIQRTEKGRQFRKYFIEIEKAFNDIRFRQGDKKHQLECMEKLQNLLPEDVKQNKLSYIKANTVVNKCTSDYFDLSAMVKKADMNKEMLEVRENILEDYLKLFEVLGDNGDTKEALYKKYKKQRLLIEKTSGKE